MIVSFKDEGRCDIWNGEDTRAARRTCPRQIWSGAYRKLEVLHEARELRDLLQPRGNRLKCLKGNRWGAYSLRINDQYRVCFRWGAAGAEEVEIVDYH